MAGTGILIAAVIAGLMMGYSFRRLVKEYWETIKLVRFSLMLICAMFAVGYLTRYSGLDATLGLAFAYTGVFCLVVRRRAGRSSNCRGEIIRKGKFCLTLKLTGYQKQQLVDASEPDQIDEQLRLTLPSEYANVPMEERHQFIVRHMVDAQSFKIVSTRELARYCSLALYYGETFARGSQWLPLLREVAADDVH